MSLTDNVKLAGSLNTSGSCLLQRHMRSDVMYLTAIVRVRYRDATAAHQTAIDYGGTVHRKAYPTRWLYELTGVAAEQVLESVRPWLTDDRQARCELIGRLAEIRALEDADERHEARLALWGEWCLLMHGAPEVTL